MALRDSNHIPFHKRPKPAYLLWIRPDDRRGHDVKTLNDYDGYRFLHTWQEGRCAMCGRDGDRLVLDHCHETGLARGFLCAPCNTKESKGGNLVEWQIYRNFPPTVLLGLKFYYNDFGQAPYPLEHPVTKEDVESGIDSWSNEYCYEMVKRFCNYQADLNWINSSEMRELIRKSIAYVRESSATRSEPA